MHDKEMLHELVIESREHLQSIEPDLLNLEQNGNNVTDELINRVFRAVHSIKGGFGFFGLKSITSLAHCMENIMSQVRDKTLSTTAEVIDALFGGIDKLRVLLDDVENAEDISIEKELDSLKPWRSDLPKDTTNEQSTRSFITSDILLLHPYLSKEQIENSIVHGKYVYHIQLHSEEDLINKNLTPALILKKWQKLGDFLDISIDISGIEGLEGSTDHDMKYSIIFSSVLDPDLIFAGLDVPQKQITSVDISAIKKEMQAKAPVQAPMVILHKAEEQKDHSKENNNEDSLRVKVGLLNNLMTLAGELVLSRNQLMQRLSRKLTDSSETDRLLGSLDQIIEQTCNDLVRQTGNNSEALKNSAQNAIERAKTNLHQLLSIRISELPGIATTLQNIDNVTSQLQENIMQTRLQPISVVFNKFPRVVRDLARKLGKQVELSISGQDVELDKSIVELLSDPLTHLVRNSVDHGIESPEGRTKAAKDATGLIMLRAYHEGGKVIVEISDDGDGIDSERVKEVATEKGLITFEQAQNMTVKELQLLIFMPGFSTAKEVTDVSGRGVGMDVVRSNIERLGGSIDIDSQKGNGTSISLKLPLTLAIIPSLIVSVEDRIFAVPQVAVEELVRIRSFEVTQKIERVQGSEVMRLRDKLLPLVRLSSLLELVPSFVHPVSKMRLPDNRSRWSDRRGLSNSGDNEQEELESQETQNEISSDERRNGKNRRKNVSNAVKVVILKASENRFGLVVDSVFDNEEIVVKPLPDYLKSTQCYAGATIMGDGKVAMIIDPVGIATRSGLKFAELEKVSERDKNALAKKDQTQEILLFDIGANEHFGLHLSDVARIDKIETNTIELVGRKEFIKQDTAPLPLVRLSEYLPISAPQEDGSHIFIIHPKTGDQSYGIVAQKVHDVVNTELILDTKTISATGILGSAYIGKHLTIILDLPGLTSIAAVRKGDTL